MSCSGSVASSSCAGNAVEIVLPKYDCLRYDRIYGLTVAYEDLWVPWYSGAIHCTVCFGFVEGRKCFFIEPHSPDSFFDRGHLYGSDDDVERFAFFSKAALEFMLKSGKRPDIIHCHDWQTALVPVLLYEIYQPIGMHDQRVCFTVHNFSHQGVTGESILWATGLCDPARYFARRATARRLQSGGAEPAQGRHRLLELRDDRVARARLGGRATPTTGAASGTRCTCTATSSAACSTASTTTPGTRRSIRWIPRCYGPDSIEDKYVNKHALRERFMLRDEYKPIVAYVGRLDAQKGVHLIHHAIFYALAQGAQFVLLGSSPDPAISAHFWHLKHHLNDHPDVHLELQFSPELAHLVYAGSDLFVMPSMFEPCGLAQQIALKYGTVPIVRAMRRAGRHDRRPRPLRGCRPSSATATSSSTPTTRRLESAMARAIGLWYDYPTGLPRPDAQRHARRSLVGATRPGLPQHLRPHQPQPSDTSNLRPSAAQQGVVAQQPRHRHEVVAGCSLARRGARPRAAWQGLLPAPVSARSSRACSTARGPAARGQASTPPRRPPRRARAPRGRSARRRLRGSRRPRRRGAACRR